MWNFIQEYIDLMRYCYLIDDAYIELNMDKEFGRGEI